MKYPRYFKHLYVTYFLLALSGCAVMESCKSKEAESPEDATPEVRTPVTVTSINYMPLQEFIELNATSSFLQKSYAKSNLNGYVKKAYIKLGDFVNAGQRLFILKTKEAEAIGNAVNRLNPDFNFSGVNVITASTHGYIAQLDHQEGDYVQDGEQLAVISDSKSFVFVMNVPYEDKPYISIGKKVEVILPGEERLAGTVSSAMPMIDSVTQTQSYAVKVNAVHSIPQNLIVRVRIIKVSETSAATLPKQAVLSDETQTEYWVMKMADDTTAVKVPVKTGIVKGDTIEILSPSFSAKDKILISGNYGLPDTALVILPK